MIDYLQRALTTFNGGMWYGWKKYNDDGSRIPDAERKNYENIIVIKDGAIKPSEEEINAKIQELKDADANVETKKASGKQKLLDLGLTEEEVKALIGV